MAKPLKSQLISLTGITIALLLATGMAVAGSAGGVTINGLPVFALCGAVAFGIQWLMFVPGYLWQTERFYDLTGSLTYISVALLALAHAPVLDLPRQLIAGLVIVWAVRLGSFLFLRILSDREDVRFRHIKPHFLRFLMTWTLQGLWVFITFAAGLAAITSPVKSGMSVLVVAGVSLWVVGFVIEVVADQQKRRFRRQPGNRDAFIQHGLWRHSRHPNYFGEILLWTGIAVAALPMLAGWQHLTLVSPVFVYLLLTRVSGINMLEAQANKRWGDDEAYREYCRRTPVLVPFFRH